MTYQEACAQAKADSEEYQCTQHVVAVFAERRNADGMDGGTAPTINHYTTSAWDSDATVASYSNGVFQP